jgi:hypothetical protein
MFASAKCPVHFLHFFSFGEKKSWEKNETKNSPLGQNMGIMPSDGSVPNVDPFLSCHLFGPLL